VSLKLNKVQRTLTDETAAVVYLALECVLFWSTTRLTKSQCYILLSTSVINRRRTQRWG